MDLMSEVIGAIRVGSASARLIRQSNRDGVRFPAFAGSGLHVILSGTSWLITQDEEPVALAPGDVVLTSSGAAHGLSQVPRPLADLTPVVMGGLPSPPGPCDFEFLCAGYQLAHGHTPRYLRELPDLIVVSPDPDRHREMRALVDLLVADVSGPRMGTGAAHRALVDLFLVHVLRLWHEQHDSAEWPRSDDPAIATALREIHQNPRRQWTVGQLSEIVGVPRTAFTRRFTMVVGEPPMRYLINRRLSHGARLLRETDATLATIAHQIGYSTEFAFSSAFRREYGVPPSHFRRS